MSVHRSFEPNNSSIRAARAFTATVLDDLPSGDLDAALLMVSELVTNSIHHAESPFRLTVDTSGAHVRVEVADQGRGRPLMRDPAPSAPSGRGLRIVDILADRWGIDDSPPGKVVWFELVPGASASRRS